MTRDGSSQPVPGGCYCSCCGAKMMPYFCKDAMASYNQINQIISENFLTVKGAALFLPRGNGSSPSSVPRIAHWNKRAGDLQLHLQTMFTLLRPEDTIRLAVRLESANPQSTRYMVVVSTNGRQDTEESIVLGMDFTSSDSSCTIGLVLPLWSDTLIHLDGDGGFSVSTVNRVHIFKPVSVQAMWSALQSLHKACEVARCNNYYPGSLFLTWVSYYQSRVTSNQGCINEWNAMQDVQSHRADSPVLFTDVPTERERTERLIKTRLREIMMQKDLENVTSKEIRTELEMQMVCNLREFKEFIDNEMIVILGQMDSPTEIFDHVYLGSEWNASNLEELQNSGVRYILNVTREIDNFFPGLFEYHNIRVYDEEATNLLEYWNDTYKFISKAKNAGAKCLVHCKMGVSRSASTVIAYAMKEYGWDLEHAFEHVKERRSVAKPNPSFMKQLEVYQGILLASRQRHNKLWRSHSDSDLSERREPVCKTAHTLGRSDPHNNNNNGPPSLQHFLGMAVLQALTGESQCADTNMPEENGLSSPGTPPPEDIQCVSTLLLRSEDTRDCSVPTAACPVSLAPLPSSLSVPESELEISAPHIISSDWSPMHTSVPELPCESETSHEPSVLHNEQNCSPASPSSPHCNDDNNNPDDVASSFPSTDSIDFCSALEKFVGLSHDGQNRPPSPRASPSGHLEGASEELETEEPDEYCCQILPNLDGDAVCSPVSDVIRQPEKGYSVRHIVTELESISLPALVSQASPSVLSPTVKLENEEAESDGLFGFSAPPSPLEFPDQTAADWSLAPVHSVTLDLEQQLQNSLLDTTQLHTSTSCPGLASSEEEELEGYAGKEDLEQLHVPVCDSSTDFLPLPKPSALLLPLEGVTELESSTDWEVQAWPGIRLARSTQGLEKVQETLRELQTFLREATSRGEETTRCEEVWLPRDPTHRHRDTELEARIRQAGLTPPSLMKRSASLAKLDRLELSADDLSDWDLHSPTSSSLQTPPPAPAPEPEPNACLDEACKKQRVGSQTTGDASEDGRCSPCQCTGIRRSPGGDIDPVPKALSPSTGARQQGRTYCSRRPKKQMDRKCAAAFLYNTM